jgi:dipeptidyl-peptidase 4
MTLFSSILTLMRRSAFVFLAGLVATQAMGQVVLEQNPRYERYQKAQSEWRSALKSGAVRGKWADDGKAFFFDQNGKAVKFDLATKAISEGTYAADPNAPKTRPRATPARGRQFDTVFSPDGKWKAVSKDRNVILSSVDGQNPTSLTTEGGEVSRIKYGAASWVYGEELEVREAMWFSPDSSRLAYYRFDETGVKDYILALDQLKIQSSLDHEAYPKAGAPNPKVQLIVMDLATRKPVTVDASFGNPDLGEYVYDVRWSPDGKELLFNRSNRKQNVMQLCAADPLTGRARTVVEESYPASWAENHPEIRFLADGHRFLWASEMSKFKNYELRDLDGRKLATLTKNTVDAIGIVRVDEKAGTFDYTSNGPDVPYFKQLHRARLDGKGDQLLTDPKFDHTVDVSPTGSAFVDIAQTPTDPPTTSILDDRGRTLVKIGTSDISGFNATGPKLREFFRYKAADGVTDLWGTLDFPSDFDPSKKYPLWVNVYGGPESGGPEVRFQTPTATAELGFLVANFAGRGTTGRGKAFRDAVYEKLGIVEMDDQAAGVKYLATRPYVDIDRVGITGTSYGGYSSAMCLLRHPECFAVAVANSSVTDWRNYDSIYTERYNGLPDDKDNLTGYDAGSAMKYANQLKGHLFLYFGSADNNVHPSNTYQLIGALNRAGKEYDLQVGPDLEHTAMSHKRTLEYMIFWLRP